MVTNRSNSNTDKEPLLNEIKHTGDTLHTMNPREATVVPDSNYNTNITIDQLQNTNSAEGDKIMTTNVEEQLTTHTKRTFPWKKLITALLLISILTFVIIDSLTTKYVYTAFQSFLTWVSNNLVAGVFAFMGVYCIATIAFIPGSILTLGGGFVFGTAVGLGPGVALASAAVFVGASLGAIGSFLLGRYLLRDWVGRRLVGKYPLITALDEAFQQKGFRIFLLLRLSPIVPFNAINYIGGVTAIRFKDYVLTLFGILPGTVLYCFIGASAGSLADSENAVEGPVAIISIVIGIVFGLLAIFVVSYYAKKEFNKIVADQERQHQLQQAEEVSTGDLESPVGQYQQQDDE